MSNTTIDQLFPIATTAPSVRESPRPSQADGKLFRAHLDRATETNETKPSAANNTTEPSPANEVEPVEPQTGQQETSTAEQDQPAAATESSEPTVESSEAPQPTEQPTDEVTLSAAAAVQQVEIVVVPEQVVSTESLVEPALADNQQQSDSQTSEQKAPAPAAATTTTTTTTTTTDSATPSLGTEAVEIEPTLLDDRGEGEIAGHEDEPDTNAKVETASEKTTPRRKVGQSSATSDVNSDAKTTQETASAKNTQQARSDSAKNTQQALSEQQRTNGAGEAPPEADARPDAPRKSHPENPTPSVAATNSSTTSSDAEITLTNLNATAEPTSNQPIPSTASTGNEATAAAGRTLGNLTTGDSATASSRTSEAQTTETPTVDRGRFVQRVSGAIRAAGQRDGQIQLRLSPPELGTLRIQIAVTEGVITARIETDNAAARAVLLDNLPALRERLAEQQITIEKFDVDVGREGQQQADNPGADERQANKSRAESNNTSTNGEARTLDGRASEVGPTQTIDSNSLDVRI